MFEGFSPLTIDFMHNIGLNNNKPWFEVHKHEYLRDFYNPMKELGQDVLQQVNTKYAEYGFMNKTARIYRDARRVRDGNPYRDLLWFTIATPTSDWRYVPGFWFELAPESWLFAMGLFTNAAVMAKLQARIDRHPKKFEKLIAPLEKQSEFVLDGPDYVRKKEAPSLKTAAWYNKKHFMLIHRQQNGDELYSPELVNRLVSGFDFLMPFYDYFSTLGSDPIPQ